MNHPTTTTPAIRPARRRRGLARLSAVLVAALVALACASAALAAKPETFEYPVTVKPLALAKGKTVQAKVVVTAPEAKVKQWWSRSTVTKVVRKGVNGGYQSPYQAEGYNCKPTVKGEKTSFVCTLKGADVPTSIRLTFAVVFRGSTPSG